MLQHCGHLQRPQMISVELMMLSILWNSIYNPNTYYHILVCIAFPAKTTKTTKLKLPISCVSSFFRSQRVLTSTTDLPFYLNNTRKYENQDIYLQNHSNDKKIDLKCNPRAMQFDHSTTTTTRFALQNATNFISSICPFRLQPSPS